MKPNKSRVMCPDCGKPKMIFESESKAKRFIEFNGSEIISNPDKLRAYYCPSCCAWHITSKKHYWKQDVQTKQLLEAYHKDIAMQKGRVDIINRIVENVQLAPNVTIKSAGSEEITHFVFREGNIFGVNTKNKTFDLRTVQKDVLNCILERVIKKQLNL